jgi:hypothetical protein
MQPHQDMVTVANTELRELQAFLHHLLAHAERVQYFQGVRVTPRHVTCSDPP